MTRRGNRKIHALFTWRPIRIALVAPIAGLALLASQGSFQPSGVAFAYSGCITTPHGTAVLYNPSFTVTGIVDATGCARGIVYDDSGGVEHGGTISGATIFGATDVSSGDGDGVYLDDSATVTIINSTIRNNDDAAVDEFNGSNMVMVHDTVSENGGRGLDIRSGATASIDTSLITDTTVPADDGDGDGVHLDTSGLVKITRSTISHNHDGGIDDHFGSRLFMSNDTLNANGGTGVSIAEDSVATINNSLITGTTHSGNEGDGDGVEAEGGAGDVTIANSRISGNADDGLDLEHVSGTVTMRSDTVNNNQGAGLYLYHATATITASLFVRNGANHEDYAQGINVDSGSYATLTNSFLESNVQDGALVASTSSLTMTGSFVLLNRIGIDNTAGGLVELHRSVLCKNTFVDMDGIRIADNRTQICHSLP
jgi:hypothetical protein